MSMFRFSLLVTGLLQFGTAHADGAWAVWMCNPEVTCIGDCRPLAIVPPKSATLLPGCGSIGNYQSYDFARRNADSFNGKPPAMGGMDSFDYYFNEGELARALNNSFNAQKLYRDAMSRASSMDELLVVGEALIEVGDIQNGIGALVRAKELSNRKVQFMMLGDAFKKAERMDQARICYDKARDSKR